MFFWLLACTSPSEPDRPGREPVAPAETADDTATTSDTTEETGVDDTSSDPTVLPLIDGALDCELPEPGDGSVPIAGDLHRIVLSDVSCNDGTPAVAYVRAALDPYHAADFVLQLDGGAYCDGGESCAARWCGEGFYDARDMSSAWGNETRVISGLAGARPDNAFAGWNHVYVPYCSSDMWMGESRDVPLETDGVAYRVHFEGARIVDAVVDGLEAGLVSDDGEEVLPALAGADRLLLAGSSAGAMGVMVHLDALAARLAPVPVTGLVDALWSPSPAAVEAAGIGDAEHDPAYLDAKNASRVDLYEGAVAGLYDGRLDSSCAAAATADSVHLCIDPGELQRAHVSTPFVMHHDLSDPVLAPLHLDEGASPGAYFAGSIAELTDLAAARPDVGVLVSDCGRHTVLAAHEWFVDMSMPTDAGPTTMHDGTLAQLAGAPVVTWVTGPSACP